MVEAEIEEPVHLRPTLLQPSFVILYSLRVRSWKQKPTVHGLVSLGVGI